jgi:predicted nucleotidyltransferase
MRREAVLELLARHMDEMRHRFDVRSLALFGSHARDEARPDSDVDLLVEFSGPVTFLGFMDLTDYLERLFGTRVDLTTTEDLKSRVRPYVEKELIRVA